MGECYPLVCVTSIRSRFSLQICNNDGNFLKWLGWRGRGPGHCGAPQKCAAPAVVRAATLVEVHDVKLSPWGRMSARLVDCVLPSTRGGVVGCAASARRPPPPP